MKTQLTIAALTVGAALSASGALELFSVGASGSINGAIFEQTTPQSTGTGVIDPFVQIQRNGNEGAYNTDGELEDPFSQFGSDNWNNDLELAAVPQVTIGGSSYYQFLLDVNENGNTPQANAKVTLNQVQIYQTSVGGQTGGTIDATTGRFLPAGGDTPFTGLLRYDMNPGGGFANSVILDYGLNSGSGSGDMFLNVPVSLFDPASNPYVVLYSHFGNPPGSFASAAGFEEWSILRSNGTPPEEIPVPEPATVIAGSLLLLPFAASMFRRFRRKGD